MSVRQRTVVLLVPVAIASGVALWTVLEGGGGAAAAPPGPLQGRTPWADLTSTGVAVGTDHVISIGVYVPVDARPKAPLFLDRVALVDATPGLRLDGVLVSTGRGVSFACVGSSRQFPPPGCRTWELEGWEVSAEAVRHRGFQLVLGVSLDDPGVNSYSAVVLYYHDAGTDYRAVYLQGGQVCAPEAKYSPGCPGHLWERQSELAALLKVGEPVDEGPTAAWYPAE